ncbi:hypothetical protein [Candidatus Finniella inopinata]|uniref:Uncharacterized protein n=1 Tax=Candidatus Finniella inopinata TaxID=1696036 RepID=A0A4Q7DJP0_9PROT|nr:hypothetical protein [Candidatus Finniella inopinata]RZI46962.1 hypothetical protein EQU50_01695 [Candidatus Finniella inopinata]
MAAFALGTYSLSTAYAVDDEAVNLEQNKALVPFSLADAEREVEIMNACDNYDDPNEPQITEEQHKYLAAQMCESYLEEEAAKTPAQRAEEKKKKRESDRKFAEERKKIEDGILVKIKGFLAKHPADKGKMGQIFKTKEFQYWADFCEKAGDHLWKQKRYDDADYFYDLSALGLNIYTQNGAASSQFRMHLEQLNQEIIVAKPKCPTPSMFHNIQQAIWAGYDASGCNDEVAESALFGLKQHRGHIIRWHLSHQHVSQNVYLREIAYAYDFVDKILSQASSLSRLRNAKRYDGSLASADLAKHLIDLGFWGIKQGQYEHNWVREDNIMIRVKSKPVYAKPGQYAAEFTIGITAENPIVWDANGRPISLATGADGYALAFDENNEVFKLAYDKGAVFVVPSRKFAARWNQFGFSNAMMGCSHFPLPGGFGDARNYYSTKQAENQLSF